MVANWALKRQLIYAVAFFLLVFGAGFLIVYPYFNKPPTCSDGKQNGDELGVDCGGLCERACPAQVSPISVLWTRSFEVVPGRYNAVAYIENSNPSVALRKIKYSFRFADRDNIYIGKREGVTFVPPAGRFAIFEPGVDTGNSVLVYTTFEFSEDPRWSQVAQEKIDQIKVFIREVSLSGEKDSPRLRASVKNGSLFIIPDVRFVAILYDKDGNALGASSTYLEKLMGEESVEIGFTWPQPIPGEVVAKEVIPMFDIFEAKLK
jgi:hypothetical protein